MKNMSLKKLSALIKEQFVLHSSLVTGVTVKQGPEAQGVKHICFKAASNSSKLESLLLYLFSCFIFNLTYVGIGLLQRCTSLLLDA